MESHDQFMRRVYGARYTSTAVTYKEPRLYTKHNASKRGHIHRHRLSRGEFNHIKFLKGSK
jgi:hypothetical protein